MRLAVLSLLISSAAFAQSDRSTITGTITDPAGAVIANAPLEARNLSTGQTYRAASTATGNYAIPELPVGNYELTVSVAGFKKYVRAGLGIQAAQTFRVDISLEVGAASESVTVTEQAPLLKTESGELSHSVTGEALNQLPVLAIGFPAASNSGIRNPLAATNLVPGGQMQGDVNLRINGTPSNTYSVRVEGQDSTNAVNVAFGAQNQVSVEGIQEFAVQTSNYAAEFGQAGGAIFVATMKSGTNTYHGSAYDYFVNEVLNASTPFVNTKGLARRNDYGFSFGGPVVVPKLYDGRNRTFFFYNFEQFRESQMVSDVPNTVPTQAYRNGDFTAALTGRRTTFSDPLGRAVLEGAVYDPLTQRTVNGSVLRDTFPLNKVPLASQDPVALAIQAKFPLPQGPNANALVDNYLNPYQSVRHTDNNSVKVDQTITQKSKLSIFYVRTHTFSPYSRTLQGDNLPQEITFGISNSNHVHTTRINYDYTLAPTLLLHVGVGYVNQHGPTQVEIGKEFDPSTIGLKGTQLTGKFPTFSALCATTPAPNLSDPPACIGQGGMIRFGRGVPGGRPGLSIFAFRPTGNTSLTWIRGNHNYKVGGEFQVNNFMYRNWNGAGTFNFLTCGATAATICQSSMPWLSTQSLGGIVTGFTYASFLLGAVDNGNIGNLVSQHQAKKSFALFIQDSWKVTRKFTLDYGVRWDYLTYLREGAGRQPSFDATAVNRNAGGLLGGIKYDGFLPGRCQCNFANNYPYAIGPRIGAAYQITPKTVFRAGIGIVYANTTTYDNYTITSDNPFQSPGPALPTMYLRNGVPLVPNPWPFFDASQFPNPNIPPAIASAPSLVDPNAGRPPRQIQWSVGLQREVVRNLVVEASFVGNRGVWWAANNLVNYNANSFDRLKLFGLDINNVADQRILAATISSPTAGRFQNKLPYPTFPTTASVAQSLRAYPQFGNISGQFAPLGDSWYDSLQLKVTKRLSHGLDASYSLAWQKSLTIGAEAEGTGGGAAVNDVFNRQNSKGLSRFDEPLVSILSINYTTRKTAGNKALSWAVRDWTVGGLFTYRSGALISAPASNNNLSALTFQTTFANRVPGEPLYLQDLNCHCFDPKKEFVLNPKAWSNPADGSFGGQAYYTDYRQQRRPGENMSLGRIFRIKERASLNLRVEFTNIFNRTEMGNPTSSGFNGAITRNPVSGLPASGFGFISTASTAAPPRQGVIVGRFQF